MELPINQDPEQLNKSVYAGWKWWQYALMGISIAAAVAFVVFFQGRLGITLCSIICIAIVAPPGFVATYKKNGLNFFEYRQKKKINQTETFVYKNPPVTETVMSDDNGSQNSADKRNAIVYIIKNLITGGKNL